MRRDARENVEKLTTAATRVFLERGLGAPLEEVARAAGVSTGTLYNRFGTREALIDAVVPALAAERIRRLGEEAGRRPDPWSRFEFYVVGLLEMQADCPVLDDIIARRYPGSKELINLCDEATEHATGLLEAAHADGSLRGDFGVGDLAAIFLANDGIVRADRIDAPARRRHFRFLLDGLRAH